MINCDRCGDGDDVSVRPQSYLRDEYLRRLETGKPVCFSLQAQFHDVKPPADGGGDESSQVGDSCWYNPTSPWFNSAWIDVASLSFYSTLPPSSTESMSFSTGCLPAPALSIPDPADETDFNSVAAVEAAIEAERQAAAASREAAAPAAGDEEQLAVGDDGTVEMTEYLVYCVTGERLNAGTDANIHISIIGKLSCLAEVRLRSNV